MQQRYQHSWTFFGPYNTAHRDIESSHRRRIAINTLIVFGGVSKVATPLDCDMLYLNVRKSRTTQPSFSMLIEDALQPQDGHFTQLLRWFMWYWRIVESLTILTFFLLVSSIRRSTKKRFDMCSILERQHCCSGYKSTIVCSNDINTHERYWIPSTPHTVALSHLIDVESRVNILIVFWWCK